MKILHIVLAGTVILFTSSFKARAAEVIPNPYLTELDTAKMNEMLFGSEEPELVHASEFLDFAKSFLGTPYVWGSTNPRIGFDCSGFVNHVSKNFGFEVPRTSASFLPLGTPVKLDEAEPGDIILFSGHPKSKRVNHMGIVMENPDGELQFIHSARGGSKGVQISQMTNYYSTRLVRIIRLFPLLQKDSIQE